MTLTMTSLPTEKVISVLNHLIEICKDGQKGFETAVESLEQDVELADLCAQCARQRATFAGELQNEVRALAGTPEQTGTVTGVLHRGWMYMKALVTGGDEDVIIEECEAAEDETKTAYEKALQQYLPERLTRILQKQYSEIKIVHDKFSSLKRAARLY